MQNWITRRSYQEFDVVTGAQMLALDRLAEAKGMLLFQMMENAGRSLATLAQHLFNPSRVIVLAGTGGNGGGGLVAARHLANMGVEVEIVTSKPEQEYVKVPAIQLSLAIQSGARVVMNPGTEYTLVIDALTGYSLNGKPRGIVKDLILRANSSGFPILSLDIPSGIPADEEAKGALHIQADATMAVAAIKKSLFLNQVGDLYLAGIGIPNSNYELLGLLSAAPKELLAHIDLNTPRN